MIGALAARGDIVMAGFARLCAGLAVIELCRLPRQSRVAVVAAQLRRDMRRALARRDLIVVAIRAEANHLFVIDGCHAPVSSRLMAGFADIGGFDMSLAFAACIVAVVAAEAVCGDAVVIERRWGPCIRVVAGFACLRRGDVAGRLGVTARTNADDLRVIDARNSPGLV